MMNPDTSSNNHPTQADVARMAGVSRTTVSFVLNNRDDVAIPPETRQRVWDAVTKLGYIPNRAAQSLRTQKTYTIAGIIQDITNPFHPAFERGIQDVAEQYGYDLIMYNTQGIADKERRALNSARAAQVEGVIGNFVEITDEDFLPLLNQGIPVVKLSALPTKLIEHPLDIVLVDNEDGAYQAVNYLISQGHRRIGVLAGVGEARETRLSGYRRALAEHGIPFDEALVQGTSFTVEEGRSGMQALLSMDNRPSAVFAQSDLMAMSAMRLAHETGLRIPQDVAIVGFDNIFAAELMTPSLTTVETPQRLLGQKAAHLLLDRLEGRYEGGSRVLEVPAKLIIRESA